MGEHSLHFAALVGSRICHDLISPIGAINNGMELMAMSGSGGREEMSLISDSVDAANARIRFFRVAYGAPSDTQTMGRTEIVSILNDISRGSRLKLIWEPAEAFSRSEVQLAFLAIQCAEQAMPFGGTVALGRTEGRWQLDLHSDRMSLTPDLWDLLQTGNGTVYDDSNGIIPAHVQFLLLPLNAAAMGRQLSWKTTEDGLRLWV